MAGLSNRLRSIESALSLSNTLNKPLEVIWVPDNHMAAQFDQIFVVPEEFSVFHKDNYKFVRSSFSFKGIKKAMARSVNTLYGIDASFSESDIPSLIWTKKIDLSSFCRNKSCYFFTCQQFYPFNFNYSWLRPVPTVQEKIDRFSSRIAGRKCIGVHIRRTDHAVSIAESPDSLFEQAIDNEIAKEENTVFFLATDDNITQQRFTDKYGDSRIMINPKRFGRNSVEATQDAAVDLLSLTKCAKLYCSYWSSFSETAAAISGAETIVCRKQV
jgi:hypothetical protein